MFIVRTCNTWRLGIGKAVALNLLFTLWMCLFFFSCAGADEIRPMSVAGQYYPGEPDVLTRTITEYFDNVPSSEISGKIIGIISPHAGYPFSGQVAATAYKPVKGKSYDAIIIIGTNHRDYFEGATIYPGNGYQTPLGVVSIDKDLTKQLVEGNRAITFDKRGHGPHEHSIEIQLPFIQMIFPETPIVPINIGTPNLSTCSQLAHQIAIACKNKNVLLVASTDLSHFHPYDEAVRMDKELILSLQAFDYLLVYQNIAARKWEACGQGAIVTVMMAAQFMGANEVIPTMYRTSGDILGMDKSSVVGYLGALLVNSPNKTSGIPEEDRKVLLDIARSSITNAVKNIATPSPPENLSDFMRTPKGAFVTINRTGQLRGCIGYTLAFKPLYETVMNVAASAAVRDPRFPPMQADELQDMEISISVLSPLRKVFDINQIEVGKHGIFMVRGNKQGILLPQVATDNGWDRMTFLKQTCRKAGLSTDAWKEKDTDIYIYSAEIIYDK